MNSQTYTELYVWGNDDYGQLGLGHKYSSQTSDFNNSSDDSLLNNKHKKQLTIPKSCSFSILIKDVSCGEDHACLLTTQGNLYAMGNNAYGKLGLKSNKNQLAFVNTPQLLDSLAKLEIKQVSCGWNHTAAVLVDGSVYSWGQGENGQLGLGMNFTAFNNVPQQIMGFQLNSIKISQISCGGKHTLFSSSKGNLYASGLNDQGQLGLPNEQSKQEFNPKVISNMPEEVKQIACGIFHSTVVTRSGHVYVMGDNSFGQLGLGNQEIIFRSTPTRITSLSNITKVSSGHHSAALTKTGELYFWGQGVFGSLYEPKLIIDADIVDMSVGGCFGSAIDKDGLLWTWGSNSNGELGLGDYEPRPHPFPIVSLRKKYIKKIYCGGAFAFAIGENKYDNKSESRSRKSHITKLLQPYENKSESMIPYKHTNSSNNQVPHSEQQQPRNSRIDLQSGVIKQQLKNSYNYEVALPQQYQSVFEQQKENYGVGNFDDNVAAVNKIISKLQTYKNTSSSSTNYGNKKSKSKRSRQILSRTDLHQSNSSKLASTKPIALESTIQNILDKERQYLEDQLLYEKKQNSAKEQVISDLQKQLNVALKDNQLIAIELQQQMQLVGQQQQQMEVVTLQPGEKSRMEEQIYLLQQQVKELRQDVQQKEQAYQEQKMIQMQQEKQMEEIQSKYEQNQFVQIAEREKESRNYLSDIKSKSHEIQILQHENQELKVEKGRYDDRFEILGNEINHLKQLISDLQYSSAGNTLGMMGVSAPMFQGRQNDESSQENTGPQTQILHGTTNLQGSSNNNESTLSFAHDNERKFSQSFVISERLDRDQYSPPMASHMQQNLDADGISRIYVPDIRILDRANQTTQYFQSNKILGAGKTNLRDHFSPPNQDKIKSKYKSYHNNNNNSQQQQNSQQYYEQIINSAEKVKSSAELLDKSAKKLLKIIQTPSRGKSDHHNNSANLLYQQQTQSTSQFHQEYGINDLKQNIRDCAQKNKNGSIKQQLKASSLANLNSNNNYNTNSNIEIVPNNLSVFRIQKESYQSMRGRSSPQKSSSLGKLKQDNEKNDRQNKCQTPIIPRKRESIEDFKAKLVRLEKNKSDLEAKMKEFEAKIRSTSQRINNKQNN